MLLINKRLFQRALHFTMINYNKFLNKNLIGVLKDILRSIAENGLSSGNHLYITFLTNHKSVKIPSWLKKKFTEEMTIIIQYEYYNLSIKENFFQIELSFNDIRTELKIGYDSIISFADPSANFGLILKNKKLKDNKIKQEIIENSNVIKFSKFKKNYSKK